MRAILPLALLAVLGFTVAGCGSGKKAHASQYQYTVTLHRFVPSGPITVTGTRTTAISNVKAGTLVICKARHGQGASVKVPRLGAAVGEAQSIAHVLGQKPFPTYRIAVTHLENGSITVSCSQSK